MARTWASFRGGAFISHDRSSTRCINKARADFRQQAVLRDSDGCRDPTAFRRIERHLDTYAVIALDGDIVTVGHRTRLIRR